MPNLKRRILEHVAENNILWIAILGTMFFLVPVIAASILTK